MTLVAGKARALRGAQRKTPVVLVVGNGVGFYSVMAGSPSSGVKKFVTELQRLSKDPTRHIKVFVVPEPYTSQRCAECSSAQCVLYCLTVFLLQVHRLCAQACGGAAGARCTLQGGASRWPWIHGTGRSAASGREQQHRQGVS
jgi:hypothetical protein